MIGVRVESVDGGEEDPSCPAFVDCQVWITERESAKWGDLSGEYVLFLWEKGVEVEGTQSGKWNTVMQVGDINECLDVSEESVALEEYDHFAIRKVEYSQFGRQVALVGGASGQQLSMLTPEKTLIAFKVDKEDVVMGLDPPNCGVFVPTHRFTTWDVVYLIPHGQSWRGKNARWMQRIIELMDCQKALLNCVVADGQIVQLRHPMCRLHGNKVLPFQCICKRFGCIKKKLGIISERSTVVLKRSHPTYTIGSGARDPQPEWKERMESLLSWMEMRRDRACELNLILTDCMGATLEILERSLMDISATFIWRAGDLFDAHESEQIVMESFFKCAKKSKSPFAVIIPDAHCLFPREGLDEAGRRLLGQLLGEIEMCQKDPKVQKSMVILMVPSQTEVSPLLLRHADDTMDMSWENGQTVVRVLGDGESVSSSEIITWDEIFGLEEVKKRVEEVVMWPVKMRNHLDDLGITPLSGVLLYGPPGTGKTMIAKAIATSCATSFIAVNFSDVVQGEVGESEKRLKRIFENALSHRPCCIFFDELQAIFRRRGNCRTDRLFSQLLIEMDAVKASGDIVVIGATNRPDLLDPSLLRPGRLERSIFVGLPDEISRAQQLRSILPTLKCDEKAIDSIVSFVAKKTSGFTCADVVQLCNEAGIEALAREGRSIELEDFARVLEWRQPSVSSKTLEQLQQWSLA